MTRGDGMTLLDRYVHAGYRHPEDFAAAFEEWFRVFGGLAVDDVSEAITRLVRGRTSSFWPTPGELSEHLAAVQRGRGTASSPRCGCVSGWVEAPPYRANGGHVYTGVQRCPACGIPAPNLDHLRGHQTPLSSVELREWARRDALAEPMTRGEFVATVQRMARRMTMPTAAVAVSED